MKRRPRSAPATAAFSLVELLVVAALLVVMYVLCFSPASQSAQKRRQTACRQNLQFIFTALQMYAGDHDGRLPALAGAPSSEPVLSRLVPRCTTRTELFICPGGAQSALPAGQPFAERRISYAYLMGLRQAQLSPEQWLMSDQQALLAPRRTGEVLFSTNASGPGSNHRQFGGSVLFGDGHAASSGPLSRWDLTTPSGCAALNPKP